MEQTKISQALASAGITMLDLVDILINMGVYQGRHESAVMGAEEFAEKYHMAPQTVRVYCKMAGSPAWTAGEGSRAEWLMREEEMLDFIKRRTEKKKG